MQGITTFVAVPSPACAQGNMRYELFPESGIRSNTTYRTATSYVADKKEDQFCVCSVHYNYNDLTANNGSCVKLDATVGRPSLIEKYVAPAVTDSAMTNLFVPAIWFINPGSGNVLFCDIHQVGLCVKISPP